MFYCNDGKWALNNLLECTDRHVHFHVIYTFFERYCNFFTQAAYERMIEAKEASVEFCKEVSRGMIQSAPDMSHQFTLKKKVIQVERLLLYTEGIL